MNMKKAQGTIDVLRERNKTKKRPEGAFVSFVRSVARVLWLSVRILYRLLRLILPFLGTFALCWALWRLLRGADACIAIYDVLS